MKKIQWSLPALALLIVPVAGCSSDEATNPPPNAVPGRITARAAGISAQVGNIYSVVAYDYDWAPGGVVQPIAGSLRERIDTVSFSRSAFLDSLDAQGNTTSTDKTFAPGTYSVVFYVSVPGNPPSHFAEVRVAVDGDKTVDAPLWSQWVHQ